MKSTFFTSTAVFSLPELTSVNDLVKLLSDIKKLWEDTSGTFKLGSNEQIIAAALSVNRSDLN